MGDIPRGRNELCGCKKIFKKASEWQEASEFDLGLIRFDRQCRLGQTHDFFLLFSVSGGSIGVGRLPGGNTPFYQNYTQDDCFPLNCYSRNQPDCAEIQSSPAHSA
jgi:hypothetical protein